MKINVKKNGVCLFILAVGLLCSVSFLKAESQTPDAPTNCVYNPSFEEGSRDIPSGWEQWTLQGNAEFLWDGNVAHSGKRSVRISNSTGMAGWLTTADYLIPVDLAKKYIVSGWIKTDGVNPEHSACLIVAWFDQSKKYISVSAVSPGWIVGTKDWTQVSLTVVPPYGKPVAYAQVGCRMDFVGVAGGTAWFDDLEFKEFK